MTKSLAAVDRVREAAAAAAAARNPLGPISELGSQTRTFTPPGAVSSGLTVGLLQEQEYANAWRWPITVQTVDRMRNDAQIEALWTAISLSVRRRRWLIDPNGARPEVVAGVAGDLGIPIRGENPEPQPRGQHRFSWDHHLGHVLLGLLYGSYYFEQVGYIGDDGLWHLRKLAPRPPRTILRASTDQDGDLASITQLVGRTGAPAPVIPVDRLVAYVWDQEGANWYGRSMLRAIHREFDIKDRLIKVDAVKHQRNGMGIPMPHVTQPSVTPRAEADALAMASQLRAGEDAAGVMPYGMEMRILGVQGTLPDTLASIKACDESMARRFLAMFAMLGQTSHGSRALGEQFVDFFALGMDAVADWVCDVTSRHVIEDWVEWNYGAGEELAPLLVNERDETPEIAVQDLISAVQAGAITIDAGLENYLRDRYGLPEVTDAPPDAPLRLVPPAAARGVGRRERPAAAGGMRLPDRVLRREPLPFEAQAAVDFQAIDAVYESGLARLLRDWQDIRAGQIDELATQIAAAATDEALASVQATSAGADVLTTEFLTAVEAGMQQAVDEAAAQGVDVAMPDVAALEDRLAQRAQAVATLLARSLSEVAGRQALARAGGTLSTAEIADDVRGHLETLSDQYLVDQFTGVISQGMNTGRRTVIATASPSRVYASELLDANTCEVCAEADGREYGTLEDAEQDYPAGGNADCLGGPRCRGSLVAVYGEAEPTS